MENLTGGTPPVRYLPCVVPCKLYFDKSKETLFSWLGVTYYLSAEAIDKTLGEIASLCAEGSALVFDCPDEGFFSAPEKRVQNTIMMAKAGGEPMQSAFSYAELVKLLGRHGFRIYDWLTPCNIQSRIIENAGSNLKAFEHVNYYLAVKKNESYDMPDAKTQSRTCENQAALRLLL